jgi:hypothetical protein
MFHFSQEGILQLRASEASFVQLGNAHCIDPCFGHARGDGVANRRLLRRMQDRVHASAEHGQFAGTFNGLLCRHNGISTSLLFSLFDSECGFR